MAFFQRLKSSFLDDAPGRPAEPSGPRSAGEALQRQREALHLDLADIAAALRIKPAFVAALEAGRPDLLPGPAYAIGFLRAYADHLGLDHGEILRRFKQEPAAFVGKPALSFPMPLGERSIPGIGTLLVAMILAICGYGTWYYLSTAEPSRPPRVAEVPTELRAPISDPHSTGPRSTDSPAGAPVSAPAEERSGSSGPAAPAGDPAAASAASAIPAAVALIPPVAVPDLTVGGSRDPAQGAVPAASLPLGASGPAGASARIVIHATADSWVQIQDAGHSTLVMRVLKAGESYAVPDRPGLAMRTGNAGGLEITVDGSPVPPLGGLGAVRRNVPLDPQVLMRGAALRD